MVVSAVLPSAWEAVELKLRSTGRCENGCFGRKTEERSRTYSMWCEESRTMSLMDPRGGARNVRPLSVQSLSFSWGFQQKSCQIMFLIKLRGWRSSCEILDPPLNFIKKQKQAKKPKCFYSCKLQMSRTIKIDVENVCFCIICSKFRFTKFYETVHREDLNDRTRIKYMKFIKLNKFSFFLQPNLPQ